jgi:3-deoxy-manno-octulosonate cytidylyltransferase (CMP-KDO synthetase)
VSPLNSVPCQIFLNSLTKLQFSKFFTKLDVLNFYKMNFVGIIPARFESTRLPGKPLADLGGKPMIVRVFEQVKKVLPDIVVATDDHRVEAVVQEHGGVAMITESTHKSGTDRCGEAALHLVNSGKQVDVIINIQGDEPFISEEHIRLLMKSFDDPKVDIATLANPVKLNDEIFNPNIVKVITNKDDFAMYFSRSPIPFLRKTNQAEWFQHFHFLKHLGIYAYKYKVLHEITNLPQSSLELAEMLEQNRWLENSYKIKVGTTAIETFGIDTPEDLEKAKKILSGKE